MRVIRTRERRFEREKERQKKREKLVAARNSCDLMGFFDYYLMPIAIQPIHTPLTYIGGIRRNRGSSLRRVISARADFLRAADRRRKERSDVCEIPAIVDLTLIINRTPGCFPRTNHTFTFPSIITGGSRDTRGVRIRWPTAREIFLSE